MTPNFQQIIESIQQLPASEQEKVLHWLEEKRKPRLTTARRGGVGYAGGAVPIDGGRDSFQR